MPRRHSPQNKETIRKIEEHIRLLELEILKIEAKDTDAEVEKFVQANIRKIGTNKWFCLLCDKRFTELKSIREHIFNRHGKKVDEVREEVEYSNKYLKNATQSQFPECSGNVRKSSAEAHPPPRFVMLLFIYFRFCIE